MNANVHKAHPWHGIPIGENSPQIVTAFIEIVPTDTVKYEIDKQTGYLKIDRPQKYSNIVPALYGFIPKNLLRRADCPAGAGTLGPRSNGRRRRPVGRLRTL